MFSLFFEGPSNGPEAGETGFDAFDNLLCEVGGFRQV
jgi:hypothetical protein